MFDTGPTESYAASGRHGYRKDVDVTVAFRISLGFQVHLHRGVVPCRRGAVAFDLARGVTIRKRPARPGRARRNENIRLITAGHNEFTAGSSPRHTVGTSRRLMVRCRGSTRRAPRAHACGRGEQYVELVHEVRAEVMAPPFRLRAIDGRSRSKRWPLNAARVRGSRTSSTKSSPTSWSSASYDPERRVDLHAAVLFAESSAAITVPS